MNTLLADGQAQIRSALRLLSEQESGSVVAGEVVDTRSLLSQIWILQADVVLLDWERGWRDEKLDRAGVFDSNERNT